MQVSAENPALKAPVNWAALLGKWDLSNGEQRYTPGNPEFTAGGERLSIGIVASDVDVFGDAAVNCEVIFDHSLTEGQHAAGIVLGYHSLDREFYYGQFGTVCGYQIARREPGFGFLPLAQSGSKVELAPNRPYKIEVRRDGQRMRLLVDGVRTIEALLPRAPVGRQVALIAAGAASATFRNVSVSSPTPEAFMVMQFGQQYDHIWTNVVHHTVKEAGLLPIRADDVYGPNPILVDIKRAIERASIVIGEISPVNANVFYEIGFADALGKPLILLANKATKLPFDLSGYRVIFYDDRIGGEIQLRKELLRNLEECSRG